MGGLYGITRLKGEVFSAIVHGDSLSCEGTNSVTRISLSSKNETQKGERRNSLRRCIFAIRSWCAGLFCTKSVLAAY
ncbi:MAG: hypothetical protein RL015_1929 [Verrucomicrobiota bacterium]|jgi:hypothetical protein